VKGDKIGLLEKLVEGRELLGSSESHQGHNVGVDNVHSHSLSKDGQLRSNVSVSNDSEGLSTDLPAAGGNLVPGPLVHLHGTVTKLASEHDDLGDDQLGDGTRVGEGRVEDGDTVLGGIVKVDLVGSDTKTSDNDQVLCLAKDIGGELGLGADSNGVDVTAREGAMLAHES
jgi:hypothetical protein